MVHPNRWQYIREGIILYYYVDGKEALITFPVAVRSPDDDDDDDFLVNPSRHEPGGKKFRRWRKRSEGGIQIAPSKNVVTRSQVDCRDASTGRFVFAHCLRVHIEVCNNNIMYTTRYVKQSLVLYTAFMVYRIPRLGYTFTQLAAQLYGTDEKIIPYHISMLICLQNYYYYYFILRCLCQIVERKKKFLIYYHKLPFFITTTS